MRQDFPAAPTQQLPQDLSVEKIEIAGEGPLRTYDSPEIPSVFILSKRFLRNDKTKREGGGDRG